MGAVAATVIEAPRTAIQAGARAARRPTLLLVARMERSVIRDRLTPDYAALHPGYLLHLRQRVIGANLAGSIRLFCCETT